MSIARVKNWQAGEVLTANDLENEFNNLANNVLAEPVVLSQQLDANGQLILLDADGDTLLDASVDDTVDVTIGGADDFRFTANTFTAMSGSSIVVESGNVTVTAGNVTVSDGDASISNSDARTDTVATPLIIAAETSGTPAAGIGTGILVKAESDDEVPCSFGQLDFSASDVTAGSEDTYFRVWLRVAGAALTECWRWVATGAFKGIFTHANTADRTYTFPNVSYVIDAGDCYKGPSSCGSGSTRTHEGTVTVASNGDYSGIHYYTDFTLNSSVTMTIPAGSGRLVVIASGTITINGTITGSGGGLLAAPTGDANAGQTASNGTDQPGGGGGSGNAGNGGVGGSVLCHGLTILAGGAAGVGGAGTAGTQLSGSTAIIDALANHYGGAPGASGSGNTAQTGGSGGRGGASLILIAPTIVLANTATLNTTGAGGGVGAAANCGGGGGGGAGNIYAAARSYTDNGATFTQTGGVGGAAGAGGGNGGDGAAGVTQINIYA